MIHHRLDRLFFRCLIPGAGHHPPVLPEASHGRKVLRDIDPAIGPDFQIVIPVKPHPGAGLDMRAGKADNLVTDRLAGIGAGGDLPHLRPDRHVRLDHALMAVGFHHGPCDRHRQVIHIQGESGIRRRGAGPGGHGRDRHGMAAGRLIIQRHPAFQPQFGQTPVRIGAKLEQIMRDLPPLTGAKRIIGEDQIGKLPRRRHPFIKGEAGL